MADLRTNETVKKKRTLINVKNIKWNISRFSWTSLRRSARKQQTSVGAHPISPNSGITSLPNELLLEIVQYLRPNNPLEPVTGFDAAWKPLFEYRRTPPAPPNSRFRWKQEKVTPVYSPLAALRSTCTLFREICTPLLYETINILNPMNRSFSRYYTNIIVGNSRHIRNIRIATSSLADDQVARVLNVCKYTESIAFYGQLAAHSTSEAEMHQTSNAVLALAKEGRLDTIGFYCISLHQGLTIPFYYSDGSFPLLKSILDCSEAKVAIKRLDIVFSRIDAKLWHRIRTELPSLEALTIFFAIQPSVDPVWVPGRKHHWGQYSNLTRLQFYNCGRVHSNNISPLVRHFPSLKHLLVSTCDNGEQKTAAIPLPDQWYQANDALWRVRKPLETLQYEHMLDWEIRLMCDIPVKILIITNLKGEHLTTNLVQDKNAFPGLQVIRIQPPVIPEYADGFHPFSARTLATLEEVCAQRHIQLTRDAVAVKLYPRHY